MDDNFGFVPVKKNEADNFGFAPVEKKQPSSLRDFFEKLSSGTFNPLGLMVNKVLPAAKVIGQDIATIAPEIPGMAVREYGKIPQYVDYLKENIPLAYKLGKEEPEEFGKAALGGLGEFAGKVSRVPPAMVDYMAHIGLISPEAASKFARPSSEEEIKNLMDTLTGKAEKPGAQLVRGGFRNLENIYGGTKLVQMLNPMKYTAGAITKDVLKEEARQVKIHNQSYGKLWKEADKSGFNNVPADRVKLIDNLDSIQKYKTPLEYKSLENFINNPTLENAQLAQSDMNHIARNLAEKSRSSSLTSEEKSIYHAAVDAEKHIEDNMFKNSKGQINKKLKKQYDVITNSYRENVVPYKYNPDIQAYKNKEMLAEDMVKKIKKGEFAAKKGYKHPELNRTKKFKTLGKWAASAELAHLLGLDKPLLDLIKGKE